jgi:Ca2+-binding RTX toxin-like protein
MQTIRLGTANRDTLFGTNLDDWFQASEGNDILFGNGGADRFDAGAGHDRMHGGNGADSMFGGEGNDIAFSGGGNDLVEGGEGSDKIYAGAGNDTIWGDAPGMVARAGVSYDDLIEAGTGHDWVHGGLGNDEIQGESGNDTIFGGKDNGTLAYERVETLLDKAIAFKGGDSVTFDLKSVLTVGGKLTVTYEGNAHSSTAGAIAMKLGDTDWTTFCIQNPEGIGLGKTTFVNRGIDEVLATSDNPSVGGKAPTAESVTRDLALERAQTHLLHQLFEELGADPANVRAFYSAGRQDQIGVEGTLKISAVEATAAQLMVWEIAYDFNGTDLASLDFGKGRFQASGTAFNAAVQKEIAEMVKGFTLEGLVSPVKNAASPAAVTIGDNLYGNDGRDLFVFEKGDGVDLIWDFEAGQDVVEVRGYSSADVDAFTFVSQVANQGRDGANPLDAGSHQKLAIILDTGGDAILFNDLGNRDSNAVAVRFTDKTMSVKELLAKAAPATTGSTPAPVNGDEVAASIAVTNSWWGGFEGQITVTAKSALSDWDVLLGTRFGLTSLWGAERGASSATAGGTLIDLNDANWNGTLAAGQTATIGFTAETGFAGVMGAQQILDGLWIG